MNLKRDAVLIAFLAPCCGKNKINLLVKSDQLFSEWPEKNSEEPLEEKHSCKVTAWHEQQPIITGDGGLVFRVVPSLHFYEVCVCVLTNQRPGFVT